MSVASDLLEEMIAETVRTSSKVLNSEDPWVELAACPDVRKALEVGVNFRLGVLMDVKRRLVDAEIARLEKERVHVS